MAFDDVPFIRIGSVCRAAGKTCYLGKRELAALESAGAVKPPRNGTERGRELTPREARLLYEKLTG